MAPQTELQKVTAACTATKAKNERRMEEGDNEIMSRGSTILIRLCTRSNHTLLWISYDRSCWTEEKEEKKHVWSRCSIKCRCCIWAKFIVSKPTTEKGRVCWRGVFSRWVGLSTFDTMTQSVRGVSVIHRYVCVCSVPNVLPILFREIPSGLRRGSLLQRQVYLKLLPVYLMNGCLGKGAGRQCTECERRTLMWVFKGEDGERVITVSTRHCNQGILVTMASEI